MKGYKSMKNKCRSKQVMTIGMTSVWLRETGDSAIPLWDDG